jgi:hypothetical protein
MSAAIPQLTLYDFTQWKGPTLPSYVLHESNEQLKARAIPQSPRLS